MVATRAPKQVRGPTSPSSNTDAAVVDGRSPLDAAPAVGEMVPVPAGTYRMGCEASDSSCRDVEKPAHDVELTAFSIDRTEVTQRAYDACVRAGACAVASCPLSTPTWDPAVRPHHPVTCVSWNDALAYCGWAGKRLPTEAEWEFAARGSDGRMFPCGNDAPDCTRANVNMACGDEARPVGQSPAGASPFGALDMAGNVFEYVADKYDASYYATSPPLNPPGPTVGTRVVVRGGDFSRPATIARTIHRGNVDAEGAGPELGFRCARTPS